MYRYVYNKLPSSLDNFFDKLNKFNRSLSFVLPKINKNEHKLLPSFALIKTWNDISLDLRRKKSLKSFKKHFSSALLENYDKICKVSSCYACRKQSKPQLQRLSPLYALHFFFVQVILSQIYFLKSFPGLFCCACPPPPWDPSWTPFFNPLVVFSFFYVTLYQIFNFFSLDILNFSIGNN